MMTNACGCGYSLPAGVGKYGCPNCCGDNFTDRHNRRDKMYEVILIAEDGTYTLTDPMTERAALAWISKNQSRYGEGQRLSLQYVQY
jgi:hypothetical protein